MLLVLLCLPAAILAGAVLPLHPVDGPRAGEGANRVLVLSNPIHTDIAVEPGPAVLSRFAFLSEAGLPLERPDLGAIVFGWGGRSFYVETPRWADLKPMPVFRALTVDSSVMHVGLAGRIAPETPGVRELMLSDADFTALLQAIEESFAPGADGRPTLVSATGYAAFDRFYEAKGRFNALVGCNTWTARVLREAGVSTGLWTPLPQTLLWSLDIHNP